VLSVENLVSAYGRIKVLHGISLEVRAGEIVTLVGANGAGKTTLLRAICGVQPILQGTIRFDGKRIERATSYARVALGMTQVPEGRQLFAPLNVEDNLKLGAWVRRAADLAPDLAAIYAMFPVLAEMRHIAAGALSGGQQQMLAIGRALMAKPRLLLLDEPSMGLAPILVDQILDTICRLRDDGLTVLLVEQNARAALAIANRAYVLETGQVTASGAAALVQADPRVRAAYLGAI
jgi:branched-chain amino acid transport system ATP-binding protein